VLLQESIIGMGENVDDRVADADDIESGCRHGRIVLRGPGKSGAQYRNLSRKGKSAAVSGASPPVRGRRHWTLHKTLER
jgi:hypothetical protein